MDLFRGDTDKARVFVVPRVPRMAAMMVPGVLRTVYDMDTGVHEVAGQRIGVYFR